MMQDKENKEKYERELMNRGIKYPYQIHSIKREKKVLGVDAKLSTPTAQEAKSPLELHSGFSRFELTIIDKDINATPTANIPADDIYYIIEMTQLAMEKMSIAPKAKTSTPPAYTTKLIDRNYKGLTPAEILIKDPSQETGLINVKNFLEKNIAKYPANKTQIVAIDNAIDLLHKGALNADNVTADNSNIEIYKTDYKFKTKKNEKGYNLIYGIEIICDPEKNYPFAVSIMNCYAPVEGQDGGQKHINMSKAEDTIKSSMLLTKMEWFTLASKMKKIVDLFDTINFETLFNESQTIGRLNAITSKK